jgi:hypothetical protein
MKRRIRTCQLITLLFIITATATAQTPEPFDVSFPVSIPGSLDGEKVNFFPQVGIDSDGRALVVWTHNDTSNLPPTELWEKDLVAGTARIQGCRRTSGHLAQGCQTSVPSGIR